MAYIEKLLRVAGAALVHNPPIVQSSLISENPIISDLQKLLSQKNGFYAFESALHVFPFGKEKGIVDALAWNSKELWKQHYKGLADLFFFAEDIFGNQFGIKENKIFFFDAETGQLELIGTSLDEWARIIMEDYQVQTGYPLAHKWQKLYGKLQPGVRLVPKIPLIAGGEYSVENLYALEAVKGMRLRGDLAIQIKELPDGAKIKFNIVD